MSGFFDKLWRRGRVWSTLLLEREPETGTLRELRRWSGRSLRMRYRHAHTYADPFLIVYKDRLFLFLEVERYGTVGCIHAYSTADLQSWEAHGAVLAPSYHVSFPQVFAHDDAIYMVPEAGTEGVWLYHTASFPGGWKRETQLVKGTWYDPVLWEKDDAWYLFATNPEDELHLFVARELSGPWSAHAQSPVVSGREASRSAGRIFRKGDALYRPVQDGRKYYGERLLLRRIEVLSPEEYLETEAGPYRDIWKMYPEALGNHHLDSLHFLGRELVATDLLLSDLRMNNVPKGIFRIFGKR